MFQSFHPRDTFHRVSECLQNIPVNCTKRKEGKTASAQSHIYAEDKNKTKREKTPSYDEIFNFIGFKDFSWHLTLKVFVKFPSYSELENSKNSARIDLI